MLNPYVYGSVCFWGCRKFCSNFPALPQMFLILPICPNPNEAFLIYKNLNERVLLHLDCVAKRLEVQNHTDNMLTLPKV